MKKTLVFGLSILALGSALPAVAHESFDRRVDRVDARLDARGERINDRLDALAAKARAEGKFGLANHLDRKGDSIEARLDRQGDWIENHLDRRGDRIERRLDRRGARIDNRFDHAGYSRRPWHRN